MTYCKIGYYAQITTQKRYRPLLCKVAIDIVAKHIPADNNEVCITQLDEIAYQHTIWSHYPRTDFWCVGRGYSKSWTVMDIY